MAKIQSISDSQKKLQGHNRFVKNIPETKPITRLWPAPADLGDYGRQFYTSIGKILVRCKILTDLDKYTWFELCHSVEILMDLRKNLQTEGYCVGFGDKVKKNPAATIYNEVSKQFWNNAAKFGLSPFDRRKIDLPVDSNPRDKVREFLFGEQ
jgi:P27 family predicted phage terminase small subunit